MRVHLCPVRTRWFRTIFRASPPPVWCCPSLSRVVVLPPLRECARCSLSVSLRACAVCSCRVRRLGSCPCPLGLLLPPLVDCYLQWRFCKRATSAKGVQRASSGSRCSQLPGEIRGQDGARDCRRVLSPCPSWGCIGPSRTSGQVYLAVRCAAPFGTRGGPLNFPFPDTVGFWIDPRFRRARPHRPSVQCRDCRLVATLRLMLLASALCTALHGRVWDSVGVSDSESTLATMLQH